MLLRRVITMPSAMLATFRHFAMRRATPFRRCLRRAASRPLMISRLRASVSRLLMLLLFCHFCLPIDYLRLHLWDAFFSYYTLLL